MNSGMYPSFLVYEFTQKCNSRCIMCNIWKERPENELTTDEIEQAFSKPLLKHLHGINLTGGEVFLRDDFARTIEIISALPKLKSIGISTNGFKTDNIVKKIESILPVLHRRGINMTVKVSIDGLDEVHDRIRGIPGGFSKAMETYRRIKELNDRLMHTGIACVIMDDNIDGLKDMCDSLSEDINNISFILPSISDGYFLNEADDSTLLSKMQYPKVKAFLKEHAAQSPEHSFYSSKLVDYIDKNWRSFACLAGYKTLYMNNFGDIYPCAILSGSNTHFLIGNVLDEDIQEKYLGEHGTSIRRFLKGESTCKSCTFSCDLKNNLREEFFEFLVFYTRHPYFLYLLAKKLKKNNLRGDYLDVE
jgi:radical SAM protein with 4Fe4S-binding SPASM domain